MRSPPRPPTRSAARRAVGAALAALLPAFVPLGPADAQLRSGFRSTAADRGDDSLTPFIPFGFSFDLRGGTYDGANACMNGYLLLVLPGDPNSCPYRGPGDRTTLSDLYARFGTAVVGAFRDFTSGPDSAGRLAYGAGTVNGNQAFGFTWNGVYTYEPGPGDTVSVLTRVPNYLQVLFVSRAAQFGAGAFDIEYNYGALTTQGGIAGVADDGGFSGAAFTAAVDPRTGSRVVQCFRGGSLSSQGCAAGSVVPEPSTMVLTAAGVGLLAGFARRRVA